MILVKAGTYFRQQSISYLNVFPTQDVAIFAYGGRVVTGPFDALTYTLDGTYTNCYKVTRASVNRVVDLLNNGSFGEHVELTLAANLSACNSTAGTWYTDGTTLYVHRLDGAAVTYANTRVYLNAYNVYLNDTSKNFYINGFDLEGGSVGVLWSCSSSARTGNTIAVNCAFGYQGTIAAGGVRAVSMDNTIGLAAFVNCKTLGSTDDGFNFHWSVTPNAAATLFPLLINCTSSGNGLSPASVSVNGLTAHDGIIGIDIGGDYEYNFGANVGCILGIGTNRPTQMWCVGTKTAFSRGDIPHSGGTQPPRDFWMDGILNSVPCKMWLDGCYAGSATAGSTAATSLAATGSAVIYTRGIANPSATAAGTITAY